MFAAAVILPALAVFASIPVAWADPIVDGTITPGEYGAPTATVGYSQSAPQGNFDTPTNVAQVGYSVYLTATDGYVFGALQTNAALNGASAQPFANLYFDLDPQNNNGSDLGFSMGATGVTAFIPGVDGSVALTNVQFVIGSNGSVLEFAIPNIDFEKPIAGLTYYGGHVFPDGTNPDVVLRLSQSFSYSVAGGDTYGPSRLGEVALQDAALPEPAAAAMLLPALGMLGWIRRRGARKQAVLF